MLLASTSVSDRCANNSSQVASDFRSRFYNVHIIIFAFFFHCPCSIAFHGMPKNSLLMGTPKPSRANIDNRIDPTAKSVL